MKKQNKKQNLNLEIPTTSLTFGQKPTLDFICVSEKYTKFKIFFTTIFLAVLMLGLVSAAADNTSIMYGQNSSGAMVPLQTTDDGTLKVELDLMNISAGSITSSGNLSLGEKITFALGETIDNIVDGWIRVTGALNVTANNLSLGGKTLRNNNGTLYFGDDPVDTNISVLHGTNDSGSAVGLSVDSSGVLNMNVIGVASDIWEVAGTVAQLVNAAAVNITGDLNVTGMIIGESNGVGIRADVSTDANYTLTSADRNRVVRLNSSAGGHTNFTLPAGVGGEVYRILNDAEYVLTIKPTGTDSIWNSGNGYGIDLPDKGTYVELRYSSSAGKWDILQKTGGKVLIEGLKVVEPMNIISMYTEGSTNARFPDRTEKHMADMVNDVNIPLGGFKFAPGCFDFPGNDEYFYYEDSTDWDIFGTNITGHKTIAFWAYFDTAGSYQTLFSHYEDANNFFDLEKTNTETLLLQFRAGGTYYISASEGSISTATWHHIALVVDGSDVGVYIDGNQVAYDGAWNTDTFAGSLYVGTYGALSQYLDGRMQDFHISYNNPYNADPNSGSTDSFTLPAAPFRGVME